MISVFGLSKLLRKIHITITYWQQSISANANKSRTYGNNGLLKICMRLHTVHCPLDVPIFSLPFSLSISLLIVLWHNLILFLLSCYYLLLTLASPWLWLLNCILEIISIFYAYTIVCKRNFRKCFADGDFVWLLCRWIAIWISPDLLFIVQHFYYLMPNGISALFVLNAFCPNHASAYFHLSYWNYR